MTVPRPPARNRSLWAIALVASVSLPGALAAQRGGGADLETIDLPAPLDAVLRAYETAWRAFDADALAELFATDGFILRPGRPPVRGREAIRAAYAGSGGPLHLVAYDYATADSVGYVIGGFGGADGPERMVGKFILALRRTPSGTWLIVADMDNGNF